MTTRAQVIEAIEDANERLGLREDSTLRTLIAAAEAAKYKSITGKPVTDPVYESPSDFLDVS